MYQQWKWIGIILILATLLVGCSSSVQPQAAALDPAKITLKTIPSEPVVGKTEIVLDLRDQKDQPLTGAKVEVSADHIDMSGMTLGGAATEQGNGIYAIIADFNMSGTWRITVAVRKENLDFKKDFELKVQ